MLFRSVANRPTMPYLLASEYKNNDASHTSYLNAHCGQHLYDNSLVWSPQTSATWSNKRQHTSLHHHLAIVAISTARIPHSSASQPHRLRWQWRRLQPCATQSYSGSYNTTRILHILHDSLRNALAMEPHSSILMHGDGCSFYILEVNQKKDNKPTLLPSAVNAEVYKQ